MRTGQVISCPQFPLCPACSGAYLPAAAGSQTVAGFRHLLHGCTYFYFNQRITNEQGLQKRAGGEEIILELLLIWQCLCIQKSCTTTECTWDSHDQSVGNRQNLAIGLPWIVCSIVSWARQTGWNGNETQAQKTFNLVVITYLDPLLGTVCQGLMILCSHLS